MNEKYQNILILINTNFSGSTPLNDTSVYNEKEGLYYGKTLNGDSIPLYNPSLFTAHNFITSINDYIGGYGLTVKYYVIREKDGVLYNGCSLMSKGDGSQVGFSGMPPMTNIPNWNYLFPPFMLDIETPVNIILNNNCYSTNPYYVNSVDDDYVATLLSFDETKSEKVPIYRFPGPYEPIFKDISLFKGGFICYNDVITGDTSGSTSTISNASTAIQYPDTNLLSWTGLENICSKQYIEINCPTSKTGTRSRYLSIGGFDFSNVPLDAIVSGITVFITRKSFDNSPNYYVKDFGVWVSKNCFDPNYVLKSSNISDTGFILPDWSTELTTIEYSGAINRPPNWYVGDLKGSDVRSPYFGAILQVNMFNFTDTSIILPQIKCVAISINYIYNKITYTASKTVYFDNNYKFDTTLNDFAKIDELIYSKVNETTNVLGNSIDLYNIYPSVDEFGYTYSDRFIFKSSWDKEFFKRTETTLKNDSGIV